ncbi:MAG: hypothetical protein KAU01_07190 [Candidatus Cloacimonetes bacterium]|nr:hypothetical protein [Candidatus Cloacimonadota bacterium]
MTDWKKEYTKLKNLLKKLGWKPILNNITGLEEWYSQGIIYTNFLKKDKVIHIEYGDPDCVYGKVNRA